MKKLIDSQKVYSDIQAIRKTSPLIHNITNYVVMEHTANCLLALGASPAMAHAIEEVGEMAHLAHSLVLNIGTLSPLWIKGMSLALKAANLKGIPVVFDPVGVGSTTFRLESCHSILNDGEISTIRGNASEIVSLLENQKLSRGADSVHNASDYRQQAELLAAKKKCIVWMSGESDIITDGTSTLLVHNGHPFMRKVTGMGCAATAITGAFLAINSNKMQGSAHAAIVVGIAGEMAAKNSSGPGSFKTAFTDALFGIGLNDIEAHMRVEYV